MREVIVRGEEWIAQCNYLRRSDGAFCRFAFGHDFEHEPVAAAQTPVDAAPVAGGDKRERCDVEVVRRIKDVQITMKLPGSRDEFGYEFVDRDVSVGARAGAEAMHAALSPASATSAGDGARELLQDACDWVDALDPVGRPPWYARALAALRESEAQRGED